MGGQNNVNTLFDFKATEIIIATTATTTLLQKGLQLVLIFMINLQIWSKRCEKEPKDI